MESYESLKLLVDVKCDENLQEEIFSKILSVIEDYKIEANIQIIDDAEEA